MGSIALGTYLIAITLLTITPGVDTLLVIRNTARGGWRDGALSSLGICSGLFIHAIVSAVGIAMILVQAAWAFSIIKLMGAAYLVWLGIGSWRRVVRPVVVITGGEDALRDSFRPGRSLREGLLSNVLNPKTAVFYMAFLPQFIDPAHSAIAQSLFLAALHFLIAMIWQCLLALLVKSVKGWLGNPAVMRWFDAVTGTVMVGLGMRVVTE